MENNKNERETLRYYPVVGYNSPDFSAEAYISGEIRRINSYDYRGRWLVLFFYPGDFTFVCPTELGDLSSRYEEIKKAGAEVLGMSTDSVYVHKAWHDSSPMIKDIKFPLLSDQSGDISRDYGVYVDSEGIALRGTFIIDPDGILKSIEVNDKSVGRSSEELIRKIEACKFTYEHGDQACPANWRPNEETLKPGLDLVGKI
jgi:NADH-dependent peroxiredoxin subunit C